MPSHLDACMYTYTHLLPQDHLMRCCISTWPGLSMVTGQRVNASAMAFRYHCTVFYQCMPMQIYKCWQLGANNEWLQIQQWVPTMTDCWHSPSGGQGVDFIKEDDAARQHLCSLEDLCQQALALAIPLGRHSFQGDVHQRHRGLACYHPAHAIAPLSKPLMLQDSLLTIAMMHLQGGLMQAHMKFAASYVVSPVSREDMARRAPYANSHPAFCFVQTHNVHQSSTKELRS